MKDNIKTNSQNKILFAVRDKKAQIYQNFFIANSIAEAIRSFRTAANDKSTQLNQFPEEFELYKICEVDQDTAIVVNQEIVALGLASTYLEKRVAVNDVSNLM